MAVTDPTLASAAASARAFSAGVSRTLARGPSTNVRPTGMPVPFETDGGIASPAGFSLGQRTSLPHGTPPAATTVDQSAPDPVAAHADSASQPRRSRTQMAALLARMIAQGQRNL
jgi:hypothetical protein